ncbi:MAG: hypothetical protein AAFR61_30055 [Bacteroidota bacterium]
MKQGIVLFMLILLGGSPLLGQKSSPFPARQDSLQYFLGVEDRVAWDLHSMEILQVNAETGGMHEYVDLEIIEFEGRTEEWYVSHDWSIVAADSGYIPSLEEAIDSAHFINGHRYAGSGDHLAESGMGGYGSLCWEDYVKGPVWTEVFQYCKHDPELPVKRIYYRPDGLVDYILCCRLEETNEVAWLEESESQTYVQSEEHPDSPLPERVAVFQDTSYYHYDADGSFAGITHAARFQALLEEDFQFFALEGALHYQVHLAGQPMEEVLQARLGFLPQSFWVEIYRQGAFVFHLHPEQQRYELGQTLCLEAPEQ